MPAVELQVPVFMHMIARQSMLLIFRVVEILCVNVLLHLSVNCITVLSQETGGTGMFLFRVAAEWQLSREEQKHHRAFLCCNASLNRGS